MWPPFCCCRTAGALLVFHVKHLFGWLGVCYTGGNVVSEGLCMTADCPQDFPYEPVRETGDASVLRGYWNVAMGLQQVDGLEPSGYLRTLADAHVAGERDLAETGSLIRAYYEQRELPERSDEGEADTCETGTREADLVSQRIVELLSRGTFALMPGMLPEVHRSLFQDLDPELYHPGEFKTEALQKREFILNGDSVVYADPFLVARSLEFAFNEEAAYVYDVAFEGEQLAHFARFISRLWQVHPFVEGNTRTVAVFAVLYLRFLGFDIDNEPFEQHARYFRDALVRANYRNAKAGVMPDPSFLHRFFENLLAGTHHELRSRDLIVQSLYDNPTLLRNVDPSHALRRC